MTVEGFIEGRNGVQRQILIQLRELIMSLPEMKASIKYKIPFFSRKSWICYLNPIGESGVELAFTRANELSNEQGALHFKDRKQVAGIEFHHPSEINADLIVEILQEAILLDETIPYASKRAKKHSQ